MDPNTFSHTISTALKKIRRDHHIPQARLSQLLGLSQAHFSKIENGKSSLTAEQFLFLIRQFNLGLEEFVQTNQDTPDRNTLLQYGLARVGAGHLRENKTVQIPDIYKNPTELVTQILIAAPSARLLAALAPVITQNCTNIFFHLIADRLDALKLINRLGWLLENTCFTLQKLLSTDQQGHYAGLQQALLVLERKLANRAPQILSIDDELDKNLISLKTVEQVRNSRDASATKWRIITRVTQQDFEHALKEALAA